MKNIFIIILFCLVPFFFNCSSSKDAAVRRSLMMPKQSDYQSNKSLKKKEKRKDSQKKKMKKINKKRLKKR
ncbi:MAG: hypothetical protein KAT68_05905 [Bacteroidales bacterium]|nr:hypothetical protein [Bacteroidales bacterium]